MQKLEGFRVLAGVVKVNGSPVHFEQTGGDPEWVMPALLLLAGRLPRLPVVLSDPFGLYYLGYRLTTGRRILVVIQC
jgi:hypothetical protein